MDSITSGNTEDIQFFVREGVKSIRLDTCLLGGK
jgi:hypothetical protein